MLVDVVEVVVIICVGFVWGGADAVAKGCNADTGAGFLVKFGFIGYESTDALYGIVCVYGYVNEL